MWTIASTVKSAVFRKLGRCSYCTRAAFQSALVAWSIFLAARLLACPRAVGVVLLVAASALTALWLMHCLAYTARVLSLLRAEYGTAPDRERRTALRIFATAAGLGVVGSVGLSGSARAAGRPCRPGRYCPDNAPNCCSRTQGICCDGNWHCDKGCFKTHADARRSCGNGATILACS